MKTQVIEGPKELLMERVAQITGRIIRIIVFIEEPEGPNGNIPKPSVDPWLHTFNEILDNAVIVGRDVDDSRESIYEGRGE